MPRLHPAVTGAYWTLWNYAIERIGAGSYLRIRYEDMVESPQAILQSVLEFAGLEAAHLPFSDESSVELEPAHTVSGNPIRFQTGQVSIQEDSAWVSGMAPSDRRWAESTSAPLRRRYGY